ncbi:hypothetical protein I6L40_15195 [Aeromonas sp. FDAARGOS 1410]|uniref:hypothetical protein n=1 Tax=Aeromonas TaxID=642 RepID=UPI001C24A1E9|nr:hypothetical protein [Aeromonas sp. FDAARGOS 1410]QXC37246.1 hypothetical protein I6L40_15195 [Aeromonas sp. FDAARGOS 1410]
MKERIQDFLMSLILEPGFLKGVGKCCITIASAAISAGFLLSRFHHRVDRVHNRIEAITNGQVVLPQPISPFAQWPLINALIPETAGAFSLYAVLFTFGLMLVYVGKQIDHAH